LQKYQTMKLLERGEWAWSGDSFNWGNKSWGQERDSSRIPVNAKFDIVWETTWKQDYARLDRKKKINT